MSSTESDWHDDLDLSTGEPAASGIFKPDSVRLENLDGVSSVISVYERSRLAGSSADRSAFAERAKRQALQRFVELENATDGRVKTFVTHHGPLGFSPSGAVRDVVWSSPMIERVEDYRDYARLVAATTRVATRAAHGRAVDETDSTLLRAFVRRERPPGAPLFPTPENLLSTLPPARSANVAAAVVRFVANWWIQVRHIGPYLELSVMGRAPRYQVSYSGGLWGAIGMQLLLYLQRELGQLTCAHCGRPVDRASDARRRKIGARVWCERKECRRAKNRDAVARHRAKQRNGDAAE